MNYQNLFFITMILFSTFITSQVIANDNATSCIEESIKKYNYGDKYYYKNTCDHAVIFAYCATGKTSLKGKCGKVLKKRKKADNWNQYYTHSAVLKPKNVRSHMNSPLEYRACKGSTHWGHEEIIKSDINGDVTCLNNFIKCQSGKKIRFSIDVLKPEYITVTLSNGKKITISSKKKKDNKGKKIRVFSSNKLSNIACEGKANTSYIEKIKMHIREKFEEACKKEKQDNCSYKDGHVGGIRG